MTDEIRHPLPVLPPEEKRALQARLGVDADNDPLGLTPAEKLAARDPGKRDPNWKEPHVDKPGYKTSEFWLKALVTLVVLPLIGFFTVEALPPMAADVAAKSPFLALVVPLAKAGLVSLLGWAAAWLAAKYGDNRTTLKVVQAKAGGEG